MSPVMAAAAALVGKLADVRKVSEYSGSPHIGARGTPTEAPHVDERIEQDTADRDMLADQPQDSQPHTNTLTPPTSDSAGLPKFTSLKGIAAPLNMSNVDTDAIIPKQFLKTIKRTGLGSAAFHALRYNPDESENPAFVLNKDPYRKAKILVVTGPNFGCGSSREHAPWALLDFGIKSVIAPSFADIFFNNTFKNGMLPIAIENKADLDAIASEAEAGREIEVDLPNQQIKNAAGEPICSFEVEEFRKHCLVNGLDDIGLTMQQEDKIVDFEKKRTQDTPWLDGSGYLKRRGRGNQLAAKAVPVPTTNRGEEKKEPLEW
jgi:3-isopropylmalate dehydratase